MRSMFVNAAFSRYDLGRNALVGGAGLSRVRLGQASVYAAEDYIQKIDNLVDKESRDKLKLKYNECQDKDGTAQLVCLAALANEIYLESRKTSPSTTPLPAQVPAPQSSTFPILPVALATLGAGALIWFLVSKGKK